MSGGRDAGAFGPWLAQALAVLHEGADAQVPCDGCTACCESSQFVLVEPDEDDARAAIPQDLLFPAPGAPQGFSVLPYDEHGRCPMLRDGACSIYEHRPRTCRAYDCRVLTAAGVDPGPGKPEIRRRVGDWRFTMDGPADGRAAAAVGAAGAFLAEHAAELPGGGPPPTQRAALAIEMHDLFLGAGPDATAPVGADPADVIVEIVRRLR